MSSPFAKSLRRVFRARRHVPARRSPLHVETLEKRINPGVWTQLAAQPSAGAQGAVLLSDGTVLIEGGQDGQSSTWYKLTPDAQGNYINGTIAQVASSNVQRLFFATTVMPSGKVWVMGGEYSNATPSFTNTGEIYDPVANTWTSIPNFPQSSYGDDPSAIMPNGNILAGYFGSAITYIYNVASNSWSGSTPKFRNDRSDEETWVLLPNNGGVLSYDVFASPASGAGTAEKYSFTTNSWQDGGSVPVPLTGSAYGSELGPALLLNDGRVLQIGANGNTVLYNSSNNTWSTGPVIPNSKVADDAPAALLPNGHVLLAADTYISGSSNPDFNPPTQLSDFDPSNNTITQQTSGNTTFASNLTTDLTNRGAFLFRMLALPNGHILLTDSTTRMYDYAPDGSPVTTWAPTISSIAYNGGRTYTLTGTNLNGGSEGASYGDDAEMSSNYPLVRLTNGTSVFYARTFNWSTTGVQMGNTPATVQFTLPNNLPFANYQLSVVASGLSSVSSMSFTPPAYVDTRWVGLSNGTAVTDVDPVLSGNQAGTVGTGAYGTVNAAIAVVPAGGVVIVNGSTGGGTGNFAEAVAINKQVNMILQAGAVSFGSLAGNTTSAAITINGTGLTVGGNNSSTEFDGTIVGAGSLTKGGSGTFTITGTDTYAGGTNVNGGTFQIGVGGTAGSIVGNVTNGGGTIAFDRSDNPTFVGTVSGSGTVANLGSVNLAGALSGTEGVSQSSTGVMLLSAANSFSGGVSITNGTVKLGNTSALGSSSGTVQVGATGTLDLAGFGPTIGGLVLTGTLANTGGGTPIVTLTALAQYDLQLFSTSILPSGLTFKFTSVGGGGLLLNADAPLATLTGVTLDFGSLNRTINVGSGGTWKLIDVPILNNGYTLSGGGTLSIQGTTAVTNTSAVTVSGGTLDLSKTAGTAAVGGNVTVAGGTLHLSANDQIPNSATVTVNTGTFDLDGHTEGITSLTGTGGQVSLTNGATLTVAGSAVPIEYDGTVSGTGGLVVAGLTRLTLTGTNTYGSVGGTMINGNSLLSVGSDASLGDPAGPLTFGGGTLQATGTITSSRGVTLNASGGRIDTNGNNVTLSAAITGAGGLTQVSTGTLTLGGTDTYAGTTAVNAGILLVTGSLTGAVTVANGATLAGSGTVGNTTVDGILAPGNGVGVLTAGTTTIASDGTFSVPINGATAGTGYSQLVANGPVDVTGSTLSVQLANGFTPTATDSFDILINNSGSDVGGHFNNLGEGDTFTANSQQFTITYHGGASGHDIVLTPVAANNTPPTVSSVVINDGSAQRSEVRSIIVTFSDAVTFAGGNANAANAITLQQVQNGLNVGLTAMVGSDAQNHTTVTLTFSGNDIDSFSVQGNANTVAGPSLADGRYTLSIDGSQITGSNNVKLDGAGNGTAGSQYVSAPDSFGGNGPKLYRLYGDVNGDGVDDSTDLGQVRATFNANNSQMNYIAFLDANNDGVFDSTDLGQFRTRFNSNIF
jgi:autotransporter-associated beta strand protein